MVLLHSVNPSILWARCNRNRDPLTPGPRFRRDLEDLLRPPKRPADPPQQNIANGVQTQPVQRSTQPTQQRTKVPLGPNIKWVNCHLLPAGARPGCPRVYWLHTVNRRTLHDLITIPDIAVTALYWGHVDALHKFLDMTRPRVHCFFHSWVGDPQIGLEDCQLCIKREGIEVTVGFLRKDSVDDWIVGCVYVFFGAKKAWKPKGSVDEDMPMEQSIAIVKEVLGPVPAYMCFVSEP